MGLKTKVLLIDDNVGSITWLVDFVEYRGYQVEHLTNEKAGRTYLRNVQEGRAAYALAIFDIMIAIDDVMEIDEFDDSFYEKSADTGIRLCSYARSELMISSEELPIICLSARKDDELKEKLEDMGIGLFSRSGEEIRGFLLESLPQLR